MGKKLLSILLFVNFLVVAQPIQLDIVSEQEDVITNNSREIETYILDQDEDAIKPLYDPDYGDVG